MYFRSSVDVPQERREELCELLNGLLASSVDLFTQAKQAHWNVKGRRFLSAHNLFDEVASHAREHSDDLAERIATLGGYAKGTARQVAEASELEEFAPDSLSAHDCIEALAERLSSHASAVRQGIERCANLEEPATEDLLTEVLREVEFDLWFLESHLEDPQRSYRPAQADQGAIHPS